VPKNKRLFILILSGEVIATKLSDPDSCVNSGRRLASLQAVKKKRLFPARTQLLRSFAGPER
jgi:hypothetical protein